jgi:biotin operon repressor
MKECVMEELIKAIESGDREAAVSAFLALPHDRQIDIIDKLREAKSETVSAFLSAALEKISEKAVQKAIKKLLFRLKTQGVQVEEPRMKGESVLKRVEVEREQMAFFSNYDPEGTRVVLLAFEIKKKQFVLIHAMSHFSGGLLELAVVPVPKDELDAILRDYLWRTQRPMVLPPISPRYASYLIDEASGLSGKYGDELRDLKPLMKGLKGAVQTPEDIQALNVPEGTGSRTIEAVLSNPIFEPFPLTWDSMEQDKQELEGFVNPSIVLPPYVVEERRQAFLKKLVEGEKLKPTVRFLKRMFEDYAYLFHALGEFEGFRSIADRLSDDQFMQDALFFFMKKSLDKKEAEQPGVLVDPFKQQPPRQPPYSRR